MKPPKVLTGYAWLDAPLGFVAGLFGLSVVLTFTDFLVCEIVLTLHPAAVVTQHKVLFFVWVTEIVLGAMIYWTKRRQMPVFGTALVIGASLVVLFLLWFEQEWYPIVFLGAPGTLPN